ncbi:50S ribosomal protein L23 [Patescibacteria group bacterium]|nr:50S ribosomal protein L23 [Patescibacteria group bacterium]
MKLAYIVKRPIITEKSMAQTAKNQYTFEVDASASKGQIRKAVENAFDVEVIAVRTAKISGKRRRVGKLRREITKPDSKKAIVEVKSGQKIDIFESQT